MCGHGLRLQVHLPAVSQDGEASFLDVHGGAVPQQAAAHDLMDRAAPRALIGAEAATGADLEDPAVTLDRLDYGPALRDKAGHRFFAENVLAGLRCGNAHQCVPMWRRRDTDDIDVLALDHATPIGIKLDVLAELLLGVSQAALVNIAGSQQLVIAARGPDVGVQILAALAATADQPGRECLAGRRTVGPTQHVAGYNRKGCNRAGRAFKQMATAYRFGFLHDLRPLDHWPFV